MTRTKVPVNMGGTLSNARLIVIHSVESDIKEGLGWSLATGWWQNPSNKSSVHGISDPSEAVLMAPDNRVAWHCGSGNAISWGFEHVGRAAFTTDQWLTNGDGRGLQSLRNSARETAKLAKKFGIPARWLKLQEIKDGKAGFCTHNDMRLVYGGTTHTDPGPGFPYALYMQLVQQYLGDPVSGNQPAPNTKPDPNTPQKGGAEQEENEDDDMVRMVQFPDGTINMVDYAAHTLWHIGSMAQVNHFKNVGIKLLDGAQDPSVYAGFTNVAAIVNEETTKVLRSEGVSGAADVNKFIGQFDGWVREMIRQEMSNERGQIAQEVVEKTVWPRNAQGGAVNVKGALNAILDAVQNPKA